jgi:hypothetical protein
VSKRKAQARVAGYELRVASKIPGVESRCCEKSYEKTRRQCPRCAKWICHYCGVIARGTLMCGDCSVLPPGEADAQISESSRETVLLLAAGVAGITGGLFGAALWALTGGISGGLYAWGAVFPGLCARLGVRIAVRDSGPSYWALTLAAGISGLGAGIWLTAFRDVTALYAQGAAGIPANIRAVFGNEPPTSLLDLRVASCSIAYVITSPGPVLFAVLVVMAATLLRPRRR